MGDFERLFEAKRGRFASMRFLFGPSAPASMWGYCGPTPLKEQPSSPSPLLESIALHLKSMADAATRELPSAVRTGQVIRISKRTRSRVSKLHLTHTQRFESPTYWPVISTRNIINTKYRNIFCCRKITPQRARFGLVMEASLFQLKINLELHFLILITPSIFERKLILQSVNHASTSIVKLVTSTDQLEETNRHTSKLHLHCTTVEYTRTVQ